MATDVDVQYFSHLNGLVLSNNWGDMIRLLDKTLVTGIDFTQITAASIDEQGDVKITLYAAHNAMLFQVVELTGFTPTSLNQKYRIKGVPSTTELILKPHTVITETTISTVGLGKLASLGYEIIFRDTNDVKRVYRAKNPTVQHPFIRIDESLASDTGSYTSTYAKSAMVGLLERMDHIDDFKNLNVLQLPFDPADPAKNWKITGTGTSVVRGRCKWFWAGSSNGVLESSTPESGKRKFSLVGGSDAFFIIPAHTLRENSGSVYGCGLYNTLEPADVVPNWFLSATIKETNASTFLGLTEKYSNPFVYSKDPSTFLITKQNILNPLSASCDALPIMPDYESGRSNIFRGSRIAALEIPFYDSDNRLRGSLKHLHYFGLKVGYFIKSEATVSDKSLYIIDSCRYVGSDTSENAGFIFYLGDLE